MTTSSLGCPPAFVNHPLADGRVKKTPRLGGGPNATSKKDVFTGKNRDFALTLSRQSGA